MLGSLLPKRTAKHRVAARYFNDGLVVSDDSAWVYMKMPKVSYDFATPEQREGIAYGITLALAGLKDADVHLLIVPREYPTRDWADDLARRTREPTDRWGSHLDLCVQRLEGMRVHTKEVYLGVKLGRRKQIDAGAIKTFMGKMEKAGGLEDDAISVKEITDWRKKAETVVRNFENSAMRGSIATNDELRWLVQRNFHRDLPIPTDEFAPAREWGPGQIENLSEGVVRNGAKVLAVEQLAGTTYCAFLAAARFPDVMDFHDSEPWLHFTEWLEFPVEMSLRFKLVPPREAQAQISKKLTEAKGQAQHVLEAQGDLTMTLQATINEVTSLEYNISKERLPISDGVHRFCVSAPTREEVVERAQQLQQHYRDVGIEVAWPAADQLSLFMEFGIGDRIRVDAYHQKQSLLTIAGGMPTATGEIGDGTGPYLGQTTGRTRSVVHYDPHVAPASNLPTAVAITGQPGGGKTNLALKLTHDMKIRGVSVIYIDPKGDARGLLGLPGLGDTRLIELGHGHEGLLDPFSLTDTPQEAVILAAEVLKMMLPLDLPPQGQTALLTACKKESDGAARPSLLGVLHNLDDMGRAGNGNAEALAAHLGVLATQPVSKLCFSPGTAERILPDGYLTVFTVSGLDFPDPSTPKREWSYQNQLSVAVMFLMTDYVRRLVENRDPSIPKAVFIDEAWMITATSAGQAVIPRIARMGRSRNTALVLISQNAGDLLNEEVLNCVTTVMAFRSTNKTEIGNVLNLLGVEDAPGHRKVMSGLGNGECLMRDVYGRVGKVYVDLVTQELADAFYTTPVEKEPEPA